MRGIDGHGVVRLIQYTECLARGEINPAPHVKVERRTACSLLIEADGGYGYTPTKLAVELGCEVASSSGVCVAAVRNSHHFGVAGRYTELAAKRGFVAIITTNATPVLGPPGGLRAVIGNNPLSVAAPRRPPADPIVLDMALSQSTFGNVRLAAAEGRPIPEGWAYGRDGNMTVDATEALTAELLMPIGGHKGYGLAVAMEVLSAALTGSPIGCSADAHGRRDGGVGHLLIVLAIDLFVTEQEYYDNIERLVADIKAVPVKHEAGTVYLPGEIEHRRAERSATDGIHISGRLASRLERLADELGAASTLWRDETCELPFRPKHIDSRNITQAAGDSSSLAVFGGDRTVTSSVRETASRLSSGEPLVPRPHEPGADFATPE